MRAAIPAITRALNRRRRYGLQKVVYELEGMILNSRHLDGRFYQLWLGLSEYKKLHFMNDVKLLIRKELLGKEFSKAVASSVIREGEVDVKSPLYRYLKSKVYEGNVRMMLSDLQSIIGEK